MEELLRELIEVIKECSIPGWFDWLIFILPVVISLLNVWLVNTTTNKQIKNQNKETYKPRLCLKSIEVIKKEEEKRHLYASSIDYKEKQDKVSLYVNVELENVGNGIANDISFYMIHNGMKCYGFQNEIINENQELNSTLEIPKEKSKIVPFLFEFDKKLSNEDENDAIILICNYKDLNNNNYKILIGCILKKYEPFKIELEENGDIDSVYNSGNISYYYYQEETEAFKHMIKKKKYKKYYKSILKDIT